MTDYTHKSRQELLSLCKEQSLKGYSTKKKDELIELLKTNAVLNITSDKKEPHIIKPFLKWVGGKTQILNEILASFPTTINNYYEPFLGGGSVLLGLLSLVKAHKITLSGKVYASDLNLNTINLFKQIQTNPDNIIAAVNHINTEYMACNGTIVNRKPLTDEEGKTSKESYYYWIRSQFNALNEFEKLTAEAAAKLLFLNKTCFRGLYREGPHGFNVPYGNYTNPTILEETHIREVSTLIKDVIFTVAPFKESLIPIKEHDFVYLDPPYAPETDKSFTGYNVDGFDLDDHTQLFELCKDFQKNNIKFILSNSDVTLVRDAFPITEFETKIISVRRAINSKNPEAKTNEVIIGNNYNKAL